MFIAFGFEISSGYWFYARNKLLHIWSRDEGRGDLRRISLKTDYIQEFIVEEDAVSLWKFTATPLLVFFDSIEYEKQAFWMCMLYTLALAAWSFRSWRRTQKLPWRLDQDTNSAFPSASLTPPYVLLWLDCRTVPYLLVVSGFR